jgi:hypothetical protein
MRLHHFTLDSGDLKNVTKLLTTHTANSRLSKVFPAQKPITTELFAENSQNTDSKRWTYANWRIYVETLKK